MKEKIISSLLCLSLLSFSFSAFASDNTNNISEGEVIGTFTIEDTNGNPVEFTVTDFSGEYDDMRPTSTFHPEHPIGSVKPIDFTVTNEQLKLGGAGLFAPEAIKRAETKLIQILYKKFPYISYAIWAAYIAGSLNDLAKKNGFHITGKLKYVKHYLPKEGYYVYFWDVVDFHVNTY